MRILLSIAVLFALTGCSGTRVSSAPEQHEFVNVNVPDLGAVPVTLDEEGMPRLPAWLDEAVSRPTRYGSTVLDGTSIAAIGMLRGTYRDRDNFRATVIFHDPRITPEEPVTFGFLFQQPNRFAFLPVAEPVQHAVITSDGEAVTTYFDAPGDRFHRVGEAPASLAELQGREEWMLTTSMGVELTILLPLLTDQERSHERFLAPYSRVRDLGLIQVDG